MEQAPLPTTSLDASPGDDFGEVYTQAYPRMVFLAYSTTGSLALAEEIAQEAFLQLYRRWGEVTAPKAWLRRSVLSLSTSWLRRSLIERRVASRTDHAEESPDSLVGVEMRIMLSVLSPRQRAAVILRFYEDLSEKDIAAVLKCRPGTVKSLLSRSLKRLAEEHDGV